MLAQRIGTCFKNTLFVAAAGGSSIVSMPQKVCSAILRGFESCTETGAKACINLVIMQKPIVLCRLTAIFITCTNQKFLITYKQ